MPFPKPGHSSSVKLIIPDSEQCNNGHPEMQLSLSKCAPYFSTLIKARWASFGKPGSINGSPFDFLSFLATWESDRVYKLLQSRQCMIFIAREYTRIQQEELSKGMNPEESRARTLQRLMYEEAKEENQVDVHGYADAVTEALRWQSLIDAIGVPEIFLIDYDDEDTDIWGDIPLPDIASVSDEEWPSLLSRLLSPTLGLKEACLRLSGVVDMIERLRGTEELRSREGLVRNIEQRIEHVLGTWKDLPGYFDEDDYSVTDSD